jgi:hypothetical protein
METKFAGSGPVASSRNKSQGASRTVAPAEEEEEDNEVDKEN